VSMQWTDGVTTQVNVANIERLGNTVLEAF
jgi:hypothetical protein